MGKQLYETVIMDKDLPMRVIHLSTAQLEKIHLDSENVFDSSAVQSIPAHWHRSIEMTYVVKGTLQLQTGKKMQLFSAGDFFVINSGDIHEISTLPSEEIEIICFLISYDHVASLYPLIDEIRFDLTNTKETYSYLATLFLEIVQLHENTSAFNYLKIQSRLLEILYYLFVYHQTDENIPTINKHVKSQKLYQEILAFTHDNYRQDLTLKTMADEFHFSREHFSRIFKDAFGKTFIEYLNDYRLYQAFPDIVQSNKTIESISEAHGFASSKALITLFKKKYHETPIKYRKRNKVIILDQIHESNKPA